MKILLVGDRGTIGSAVADLLASRGHTVIGASRSHPERCVDLTDAASIDKLYAGVGTVDAVACAGGHVVYGSVSEMSYDKYLASLCDKGLGQIELVRRGLAAISPRGSFTLITGVLFDRPIVTGSAAAAANGPSRGSPGRPRSKSARFASTSSARHFSLSQSPRAGTCSRGRQPCPQSWWPTPTSGRSSLPRLARSTASTRPPERASVQAGRRAAVTGMSACRRCS